MLLGPTISVPTKTAAERVKEWRLRNPEKLREHRARYRQKHKEKRREYTKMYKHRPGIGRKYRLKHKFGISLEEYNILLAEQNFVCAICKNPEHRLSNQGKLLPLSIDHNHKTDKIRGLLCRDCNTAIGFLKENIESFKSAIAYLEKYNE